MALSHDNHTAYIIDGMALLQALDKSKLGTFNDLGLVVMQTIQSLLTSNLGVTSVTLVFDRYDCEIVIKQLERDRRTDKETTPTYVISGRRRVPNYRTFMKNATNKSALTEFICVYLTDTAPQILKEHQWLMLAGVFTNGQLVKVVEHTGVRERPELFSTHEEADTIILLHTIDLATTHSRIIVRCCDTDVLVLLIYICGKGMLANYKVYMNAGHYSKTTNRQRFIPVNEITSKIGHDVSICLPASHAISGCDTTASLFKIGKRTAYNTLVVDIADMLYLAELIQSSDVTNGLPTATKYALLLYGVKGRSCQSLNRLRYNYACKSDTSASLFRPTDDAFEQHTRRVNYQVAIWIHSHEAKPDLWNPDGNGWQLRNNRLEPVMFERDAAPKEFRDLTHLYCIDEDCSQARTYQCLNAKLTCTEFCSCNCDECSNRDHTLLLNDCSDDEND